MSDTPQVDMSHFPHLVNADGVDWQEGNRQWQRANLESMLRWIAADPGMALAADNRQREPDDQNVLPFELHNDMGMVILEVLADVVPERALELARLIDADLQWFGDDGLTAAAFINGPEWALERDRARMALDLMGLERDDQKLFTDESTTPIDKEGT